MHLSHKQRIILNVAVQYTIHIQELSFVFNEKSLFNAYIMIQAVLRKANTHQQMSNFKQRFQLIFLQIKYEDNMKL
jgi:hypothetical protein